MGCKSYLQASKLLILADTGGRKEPRESSEGICGKALGLENTCQPGFGTVPAGCRKIQKITFRIVYGLSGIRRPDREWGGGKDG